MPDVWRSSADHLAGKEKRCREYASRRRLDRRMGLGRAEPLTPRPSGGQHRTASAGNRRRSTTHVIPMFRQRSPAVESAVSLAWPLNVTAADWTHSPNHWVLAAVT